MAQWREAFAEFLLVPTCVIGAFLLLAAATFWLDHSDLAWLAPLRTHLQAYVFADEAATSDLLGTISAGLITITSITISMLLIALQQSASALTHQVYDQFLRTWHNQVYFGVFVGLSLYALLTLASVGPLNPVLGGGMALLLTILAMCLLVVLFYTTVNQMRPEVIIDAIRHHALLAREDQLRLVCNTRRTPQLRAALRLPVAAQSHGFITGIDIDAIRSAAALATAEVEVVLHVTIGSYVVFGQVLADVIAHTSDDAQRVAGVLEGALHRAVKRNIVADPLDAIEELETIGWTAISSAQSDPDAGVLTIYSLRDILARWTAPPNPELDGESSAAGLDPAPVVYVDDVLPRLLDAFESLAVSASESMQYQSYAEILRSFELLFAQLPAELRSRVEDLVLRSLSALGEFVLTHKLEAALTGLIATLEGAGRSVTAAAVRDAREQLAQSIGKLGARGTRVGRASS